MYYQAFVLFGELEFLRIMN